MKSMPASSARRAKRRQSGQLADHRSGTVVAERPEEQLAPKIPILSALALYMPMRSGIDAERASTAVSIPAKPTAHPWRRLLRGVLACRIGPAQRRRENHLHVTADRVPRMGAELERLDAAAERGELIDGLRALITTRSDAGGESIIGIPHAILAEPYVLRPHCNPDRRAR